MSMNNDEEKTTANPNVLTREQWESNYRWFWMQFIGWGCLIIVCLHMMLGCVEIGGSTADVCSGTECGTHDESDNSDNTNNSTTTN